MSNLPLGAEFDLSAPFNVKEKVFNFDLYVEGLVYWGYSDYLDKDEALEVIRERLISALSQLGDIDIVTNNVSVY